MTPLVIIQGTLVVGLDLESDNAHTNPAQFATFVSPPWSDVTALSSTKSGTNRQPAFWATPNAAVYTALLKDSYQVIKAAAPKSTVISGRARRRWRRQCSRLSRSSADVRRRCKALHGCGWLSSVQLPGAAEHLRRMVGLVEHGGHLTKHPFRHGCQRQQREEGVAHRGRLAVEHSEHDGRRWPDRRV